MQGYNWDRFDYRQRLINKFYIPYQRKMEEENRNLAWDYGDEYAFGEEVDFEIKEITHDIRPKSNQALNTETASACTMI